MKQSPQARISDAFHSPAKTIAKFAKIAVLAASIFTTVSFANLNAQEEPGKEPLKTILEEKLHVKIGGYNINFSKKNVDTSLVYAKFDEQILAGPARMKFEIETYEYAGVNPDSMSKKYAECQHNLFKRLVWQGFDKKPSSVEGLQKLGEAAVNSVDKIIKDKMGDADLLVEVFDSDKNGNVCYTRSLIIGDLLEMWGIECKIVGVPRHALLEITFKGEKYYLEPWPLSMSKLSSLFMDKDNFNQRYETITDNPQSLGKANSLDYHQIYIYDSLSNAANSDRSIFACYKQLKSENIAKRLLLDSANPSQFEDIAFSFEELNDYESEIWALEEAIKLVPKRLYSKPSNYVLEGLYLQLADASMKLGIIDDAIGYYANAIDCFTGRSSYDYMEMIELYAKRGKLEDIKKAANLIQYMPNYMRNLLTNETYELYCNYEANHNPILFAIQFCYDLSLYDSRTIDIMNSGDGFALLGKALYSVGADSSAGTMLKNILYGSADSIRWRERKNYSDSDGVSWTVLASQKYISELFSLPCTDDFFYKALYLNPQNKIALEYFENRKKPEAKK